VDPRELHDRRVGVLGIGRSGRAAVRWLRARGAVVVAFDDRGDALAEAVRLGAVAGDAGDAQAAVTGLDLLVVSPGVPAAGPRVHPLVAAARRAGVPLTVDVQLFRDAAPDRTLVGVTGTNGKSTTTALVAHLLRRAGQAAEALGNIGVPVLAGEPDAAAVAVVELSSFQLELVGDLRPRVAVWTNFAPDHLDRHGDLGTYLAAKRRLFGTPLPDARAVVAVDDPTSAALARELVARGWRVVRVSVRGAPAEVTVDHGRLREAGRTVADLRALATLRGRHNHQNAALAYAAVRALGLAPDVAAAGLADFPGLPHRMCEIARIGRVRFVDDSKATNPEAAARSLACFEAIHWIAGGRPKPGGFASLRRFAPALRGLYAVGEAAAELVATFRDLVPCRHCGTLERAVAEAFAAARADPAPQPVVLLAPACASFDQFPDYAARGRAFAAAVESLRHGETVP